MSYADYTYYTEAYLGNVIPEDDFPRLSLRASQFLDYYTQGRAEKNADINAVKMACCALAEQYLTIEQAQKMAQNAMNRTLEAEGAEVQSETVGPLSTTYLSGGTSASSAATVAKSAQEELANIARQWLVGTSLLYRGGRPCGCCYGCSPTL